MDFLRRGIRSRFSELPFKACEKKTLKTAKL
jgi:hypothetical protein